MGECVYVGVCACVIMLSHYMDSHGSEHKAN